jgi:hypothetical protein
MEWSGLSQVLINADGFHLFNENISTIMHNTEVILQASKELVYKNKTKYKFISQNQNT